LNTTLPNVTSSPGTSSDFSICTPFTKVPLLDPASVTSTPPGVTLRSACFREIVGSTTAQSFVTARPTLNRPLPESSKVYVLPTPIRR